MNQLEIDYLAVGDGKKSGDAVAIRYGDFSDVNLQYVIVIDGGTKASGEKLVNLIKETYGTNTVDLIVCTHPDGDHASGLRTVMEELNVHEIWMHLPWNHSERIRDLFHDGRITDESLKRQLRKGYKYAYELEQIAIEKGVKITEPFSGLTYGNGILKVLGPTDNYYEELLPDFARSPQSKKDASESLFSKGMSGIKSAINWIEERLDVETLDNSGETSAENNSSAVVLLDLNDKKFLFPGDVGIPSLNNVIEYAEANYIDISNLECLMVPHHGSQRNIGPDILDTIKAKLALVSASAEAEKHPSYKVTNALKRRGSKVYTTEGQTKIYHDNVAAREGVSQAQEFPFQDKVQE